MASDADPVETSEWREAFDSVSSSTGLTGQSSCSRS